ncbi:MAG: hypothetical protein K5651_01270 [Bacteroidales bacterium]|nr:hypothetical protein [Bacteroidales bacterium]
MKKLLLLSLALVGLMSLASCKKVLAPSAITVDNTEARVTIQGTVQFKLSNTQTLPAPAANTVVTATVTLGTDAPFTVSGTPNDAGIYTISVPIKYNTDKANVSAIKAVVDIPNIGVFKGSYTTSFNVDKNGLATGKNFTCTKEE